MVLEDARRLEELEVQNDDVVALSYSLDGIVNTDNSSPRKLADHVGQTPLFVIKCCEVGKKLV